ASQRILKNVDEKAESRFDCRYENKNECIDVGALLFRSEFFLLRRSQDGHGKDGQSTHNEWTGKFDGKDYAVTGDPTSDMRSYSKVADRTLKMTVKKDGKVTAKGRIVVSADGKSRTVITSRTDVEGKKIKNIVVYDKQ